MADEWTRTEEGEGEEVYSSVNTISDTLDIVEATGITAAQFLGFPVIRVRSSTAGDCNISTDPQIAAGDNGRILEIHGTDDTRTVTIEAGDGVYLQAGASSITLGDNDVLVLRYMTDIWVEVVGARALGTLTDPVLNGDVSGTAFLDEDDMASDSATKLASQQSIKAYADNAVLLSRFLS